MLSYQTPNVLPGIMVSETEEHLLTMLATAAQLAQRSQDVANTLLSEMERAEVVSDRALPDNVVRMNSRVEFEIDGGNRQSVELVFPNDANIDEKRISVLTPIGAALIGLSPGQTMTMRGRDGREQRRLTVLSVTAPATPQQSR